VALTCRSLFKLILCFKRVNHLLLFVPELVLLESMSKQSKIGNWLSIILKAEKNSELYSYRSGIVLRVIIGVAIIFSLYMISLESYLLYHDLVEMFSIIIAFGIFLIIWNSYKRIENHFFTILAIGIAFSAIFDLLHVVTYKGMNIIHIASSDPSNLATQLWVIARFLQVLTYIVALFVVNKVSRWKVALVYVIISVLILSSLFIWHIFPVAYTNGHLTLFKRISEYILSSLFLLASILVYRRKREFDKSIYKLLILSLIITVLSEFSLTLYTDVYGVMNFMGHVFKLIAFYLLYRAIIVTALDRPHDFLFHKLVLDEEKLKNSDKELRLKNNLLKREYGEVNALLSSIGDGVVAMDKTGIIRYTNPAFNKLVGHDSDELVNKNIFDVLPFYDEKDQPVPKSERPLWVAVAKGKFSIVKRTNFYFINHSGQQVNLSITATPVIYQDKITGGIVVFRDTTKEKEIERTKIEYISFAAHQLRTPLSTIGLTMEVIQQELSKKNPSDVSQYLNDIVEETDNMADTVNQFLNVTKIEANLFTFNLRKIKIAQVLSDHIRLRGPHLEAKNIEVVTNFDPELPSIKADPKVIEMIIENLFSNAIKYSKEGGKIKVEVKKNKQNILISVRDDGFGIPKAEQSKVFKKLFRASNINKSEGTGLGLYIVRMLVGQTGGKIWFESNENGTIFYVSYPLSGMKTKKNKKIS